MFAAFAQALIPFYVSLALAPAANGAYRVEDAYKFLFHATLGGDHAVSSTTSQGVKNWMDREWASLGPPVPGEIEFQPLDPGGRILRWHLRPAKARGVAKDTILQAFITSAQSFKGDQQFFVATWNALGAQIMLRQVGSITWYKWRRLDVTVRANHYPAIDHSEGFEFFVRPAYRVVRRANLPK